MKKLVLILTLVCICAFAAPAFANPFSDVAADHWAYDAIDKLSEDGILVGNPDGTYKGNKTMTRYEMATMVARAMAASEADDAKISAENKALIDKLAAEFGSELDALGVRVTALEDKVGNVKFTGVARIRMVNSEKESTLIGLGSVKDKENKYDMRIRLKATAQVNDKVTVNARFTTGNVELDSADGGNHVNSEFDLYNVKYATDNVTLIVGRDEAWLGKGTIIDEKLLGAQLVVPFGGYTFAAISGRLDKDCFKNFVPGEDINLTAFELNGKIGKLGLGVDYGKLDYKKLDSDVDVWGVNADYAFNDRLDVWAEYVKTDLDHVNNNDNDAILVGVNYKAHPRLGFDVTYGKIGSLSVVPGISTWADGLDFKGWIVNKNVDMWKIGVNYDLMKNVNLYANYWNVSGKEGDLQAKVDNEVFETGLEFKF